MNEVAFVPIKFNSTRLKNKNIADLGGVPLCQHVFNSLKKAGLERIYVYCSDSKIKQYVPEYVNFLKRDVKLDADETKGMEIYKEFQKEISASHYILAHATSPFLKPDSIQKGIKSLKEGFDSALTVKKIQTFVWHNNQPLNYSLENVPRTQNIEPIYIETSGFYMFESSLLSEGRRIGRKPYLVEVGNIEAIDIDEAEDLELSRILISSQPEHQ